MDHLELVALNPGELATAQQDLVGWCRSRIGELANERADAEERLRVTANTALHTDAFTRQVSKARREIVYYQKLIQAIEAGYLIIPNFPISVFAIRTNRRGPSSGDPQKWSSNVAHVTAQALPPGEGEYVGPVPTAEKRSVTEWNVEKKEYVEVERWFAEDFRNVGFPVALVKPTILDATNRALALKLFDEIGLVGPETRKGDPIVVGRIRHPVSRVWHPRFVTFYIAWWLDTRTL